MDIDLLSLLTQNGVEYTDHGHYVKIQCINPAHEDKTPSMTILKDNGFAKCWSCGATYSYGQLVYALTGAPPFKNTEEAYSASFKNTLSKNKIIKKDFRKKERKLIMKGQLRNPLSNKEVMDFLDSIYINKEIIREFRIQYMLKGSMTFIKTDKMTPIYNRICIPLYENKQIVNYECRDFTGKGKPKVLYPKGGKSDILFNYDNLDFEKPLYIVEGIKSALRIYSLGYKNVTATLGASLGKNQIQLIRKMEQPILFPDNDRAGHNMVEQFEKTIGTYPKVTFMEVEGYDPADGTVDELRYALTNPYSSITKYYIKVYNPFSVSTISW